MKLALPVILLLWTLITQAQQRYAYLPEGKVIFSTSFQKMLLRYKNDIVQKKDRLNSYVTEASLANQKGARKWNILDLKPSWQNADSLNSLLNRLHNDSDLLYAGPLLVYKDGTLQGLTNQVIIRLKTSTDINNPVLNLQQLGIQKIEKNKYIDREYILTVAPRRGRDALDIADQLFETGLFEYCEPDFVKFGVFHTNDPMFNIQWGINNTGLFNGVAGDDINVAQAWSITTGGGIRVAVVDEGVDLNQPDLQGNLLPGFDALGQGTNGAPTGDDAHGTACAGIIAAVANNNLGIAGVANTSQVIPVRVGQNEGIQSSDAANGINWAASAAGGNADILSCSWGGGSSSSTLNSAIANAISSGRGGRGCVVLFASGDDGTSTLSYPSNQPNVIAVGGTNPCDQRFVIATTTPPNSCNFDTRQQFVQLQPGGATYGTGLGVVAPGINIATTDIAGPAGFSNKANQGWIMFNQDYVENFDGTSASCPFAAATMALILSANPNLTYSQATSILELTAAKVGGYNYSSILTNGSWNNEMGYGRVNAGAAVCTAYSETLAITSPNGSNPVCTSAAYSVNTALPVTWSVSPANIASLSCTNCAQTTLTRIGNGVVTLSVSVTSCNNIAPISKLIGVGVPNSAQLSIISQGPTVCPNVPVIFGARYNGCDGIAAAGITNFNWTVSPSATISNNSGSGGCNKLNNSGVLIRFPSPRQYNVTVTAQNACGTSGNSNPYVVTATQTACGGSLVAAAPNPSPGQFTIMASDQAGDPATTPAKASATRPALIRQIRIYNHSEVLIRAFDYGAGATTPVIDLSDQPSGIYVAVVTTASGNATIKLQVLK